MQVRLKREHLNIAKFEPEHGLDPMLDLALVGSEWQFRIQSRASNWQDNLVVTSTRSVEQDALSPTEVNFCSFCPCVLYVVFANSRSCFPLLLVLIIGITYSMVY